MCTSERVYNFFRQKAFFINKKKKEMFKKRRKTVPLFSEKSSILSTGFRSDCLQKTNLFEIWFLRELFSRVRTAHI